MRIVYFILGLSFLIFFHELGHFLFAKLFKVYVYEFSIFMGPKLFQKKIGETKYSIRLLPIGGYVSMAGENDSQSERNAKEIEEEDTSVNEVINQDDVLIEKPVVQEEIKPTVEVLESEEKPKKKKKLEEPLPDVPFERTLLGIANWKKLLIMFAGPLFNFILCFVLMFAYFAATPTSQVNVETNSAAYEEGLRSGDTIKDIYVLFYEGEYVYDEDHFIGGAYREGIDSYSNLNTVNNAAYGYLYKELQTKYESVDNFPSSVLLEVRLKLDDGDKIIIHKDYNIVLTENKKALDTESYFTLENLGVLKGNEHRGLFKSIGKAASTEVTMAGAIYEALGNLFTKDGMGSVAGPVGMYSIAKDYMAEGFMYYLYFIAMISVNLGIMNLLPFPALDGGKIVLTVIEMISRKKVNSKVEAILNLIGFALLMLFMLFVTFKDIFFPSV